MIERIIEWSLKNRFIVLCAAFLVLAALLTTGNLPTRRFSELQDDQSET